MRQAWLRRDVLLDLFNSHTMDCGLHNALQHLVLASTFLKRIQVVAMHMYLMVISRSAKPSGRGGTKLTCLILSDGMVLSGSDCTSVGAEREREDASPSTVGRFVSIYNRQQYA